jgi:hypothetical protein
MKTSCSPLVDVSELRAHTRTAIALSHAAANKRQLKGAIWGRGLYAMMAFARERRDDSR